MYDRILTTLDGTPRAEQALVYAVSLARRARARLHLATVRIPAPGGLPKGARAPELQTIEADYLEATAERAREAGVESVFAEVLTGDDLVEALESHRKKVGAVVTVMSTHGRGPVRRGWMGSVADRFVRASAAPTLLVRPPEEDPLPPTDLAADAPITRVLVPLDGSEASAEALGPALDLCRAYEATCILLRIIHSLADVESVWLDHPFEPVERQLEEARRVAERELDEVCEGVRAEGVTAERASILSEHIAPGILEHAREAGADLVAMATHGRGGLPRLVLGSVADKVIRAAPCPVLVVPPERR